MAYESLENPQLINAEFIPMYKLKLNWLKDPGMYSDTV